MKRNPNISLKKPEHLQKVRKDARDPNIVYDFYEKLRMLYDKCNLSSVDKACFVFNCDESGFACDPSRLRAIGEKGKPLCRVSGGSGRESTTVLVCVSADGACLPPLIVYKGAAVQARWTSLEAYPGTEYAASKNGWMEEPQFFHWFKDCFISYVQLLREKKRLLDQAAVLLYDGHSSHVSIRIIEEALNSNIQLVRLPSHLTDRIQPLDKCVFGPVKVKWDKKLVEYGKTQVGVRSGTLTKEKFGVLLGEVLKESVKLQNVVSGFVTTGIFPVDPKQFPEELFDAVQLQRYKDRKSTTCTLLQPAAPTVASRLSSPSKSVLVPNTSEQVAGEDHQELGVDLYSERKLTSPQAHPRNIVEIFSNVLHKNVDLQAQTLNFGEKKNTTPVPRLKQSRYGEVLTATEVLEKLKEAHAKREQKGKNIKTEKSVAKKRKKLEKEDTPMKTLNLPDHSTDDETEEQFRIEMEVESTPEVMYESPTPEALLPGCYILVDFLGGKRNKSHYTYLCVINSVTEDKEFLVTGLKSVNAINTSFTVVETDTSTISYSMIKALLPVPKVESKDRKLIYVFPGSINVNEKK